VVGVDRMHALGCLPIFLRCFEGIDNMNAFDDENAVIGFFNFSADFRGQLSILGVDFAHIQCAAKCADQSTAHGRHKVVQCCGMGLPKIGRVHSVMSGDSPMDAKSYGRGFSRQLRVTQWPPLSFNVNFGHIRYFSHSLLLDQKLSFDWFYQPVRSCRFLLRQS
jgi:hypothetical protein